MAKRRQILKINDFSGGLNNNASTTNIQPNESISLTNLKTDRTGTLRTIRDAEKADIILNNLPDEHPAMNQTNLQGKGIFGHGSDMELKANGVASTADSGEFLTYHANPSTFSIAIHSRADQDWLQDKVVLTESDDSIPTTANFQPAYYVHNGTTRVCDSNFSNNVEAQWHGYINQKLYKNSAGTPFHTIEKWHSSKAGMKSLLDLGIACKWTDATTQNVTSYTLIDQGSIVLGVSEAPRVGSWNGQYKFGITPVYFAGQEGPITECQQYHNANGAIKANQYAYFDRSAIQIEILISTGPAGTIANNDAHLLGDERINAVRIYVQREADENWYRLIHCSLEHGYKKTNWEHTYDGTADVNDGVIASGDITAQTWGSAAGGTEHTLTVRVDKGTHHASFIGKTLILQLQGFHQTPLSHTFEGVSGQTQDLSITVTNPVNTSGSNIEYRFVAGLLNESYFPIMVKKITKDITHNTKVPEDPTEDSFLDDTYDTLQDSDYI